ncbi:zinc finger protein castor homolog 1 [Puma concolor]|uniref:Zinc finger protein castor homolog 1 n=1 Tax=Puma concolor TaxID=9696 RepID=A0A6P6GYI1_PUMCO|nr:zinc finger protein castor homolog 1 [Puma concolor]
MPRRFLSALCALDVHPDSPPSLSLRSTLTRKHTDSLAGSKRCHHIGVLKAKMGHSLRDARDVGLSPSSPAFVRGPKVTVQPVQLASSGELKGMPSHALTTIGRSHKDLQRQPGEHEKKRRGRPGLELSVKIQAGLSQVEGQIGKRSRDPCNEVDPVPERDLGLLPPVMAFGLLLSRLWAGACLGPFHQQAGEPGYALVLCCLLGLTPLMRRHRGQRLEARRALGPAAHVRPDWGSPPLPRPLPPFWSPALEPPRDGGGVTEEKESDGAASKDDSGPSTKQASGEASSLRDYAASTMTEFLGMFGYDDQNTRDELARKISFEKLHAGSTPEVATSSMLPASEDALSKRARFSKYEEYIRKLKAGEQLSWPAHSTKAEERAGKDVVGPLPGLRLPSSTAHLETKATILPLPSHSSVPMQGLVARTSKYDFFIQKLKTGENLRPQNGSTYKKPSKYDLENVKYLHLFKPGEGSPDMGGAIAFKTGKVGRPSKYDVRAIQKPGPAKVPPTPSLAPAPLPSVPSAPSAPGPGPEPSASLPFNTPEYLKSTFSKTDSITTGTVSTVKNGLPTDKPAVTEDVNIYQKYIARFSGSQHCGHIHCAYQYREHYHCLDPECNYQVGCNKVYTSTSDVMTHENFHKKNTQLINDGFQRFRATEDCGTADCQFYGQKTTHFHCRRPGCTFTFKNKCDIEKHKSYHIKDDAYAKDGFKKFYKYEECRYEGCVYSKATNHFHCIRAGCGFTFTSTSQMTSHKRKHERRHVRSSGALGLPSSLLGAKDTEHEESSNDDLVDFSALSSKNSSLSASPTSQQSSASLAAAAAAAAEATPGAAKPPNSKISGLLSQGLPASIPLALALSNSGLPTAAPYFPILPSRGSASLPVGAPGLLGAMSSGAVASAAADTPALAASGAGDSAPAAATSVPVPPASIMERISASKGLISPMMARLAAAALKPSATFDPGNGQQATPARFPPAPVKQEPGESAGAPVPHEVSQDRSLDLTVKEPRQPRAAAAPTAASQSQAPALFSSQMSQGNPNLGSLLNIKTEAEGSPAVESSPFLGKAVKALVQEKLSEPWKVYLRRFGTKDFCDAQCDFLHKAHFHCVVEECGALFSTLDGAIKHANFHFRTEGGAVKGNAEAPFPTSAAETKPALAPSSPPAPPVTTASLEGPTPSPAAVPSTPTLLAWKQLASTIPQMPQIPASVPHLPTSPLATTSLENAKPQVKPGFLQFQENDPCLATDCKYANKFHFHCLFGNCKYVCKTSGKAESHCLDHINPNNNLVNVRDQFAYYSLQCLCPNQHCEFRMRGHYHCLRTGCYFVTNITTKLPWHIKKHEKAERRAANGFKYFTKREECGRLERPLVCLLIQQIPIEEERCAGLRAVMGGGGGGGSSGF